MLLNILLQAAAGVGALASGLANASPWIALGGAALQGVLGISQLVQARRLRDTVRKPMTTPKALTEYLQRRKFGASVYGMPGQGQMEAKLARTTAGTVGAIERSGMSGAEKLGAIAAVDQSTKEAQQQMGVSGAQFKQGQEMAYDQALGQMAAEERRQFDYNVAQPFRSKELAYASLYQGGMTNLKDFATGTSKIFQSFNEA